MPCTKFQSVFVLLEEYFALPFTSMDDVSWSCRYRATCALVPESFHMPSQNLLWSHPCWKTRYFVSVQSQNFLWFTDWSICKINVNNQINWKSILIAFRFELVTTTGFLPFFDSWNWTICHCFRVVSPGQEIRFIRTGMGPCSLYNTRASS